MRNSAVTVRLAGATNKHICENVNTNTQISQIFDVRMGIYNGQILLSIKSTGHYQHNYTQLAKLLCYHNNKLLCISLGRTDEYFVAVHKHHPHCS